MSAASRSIRLRLIAAAAVTIAAALAVAGLGLQHLFQRHVERRTVAELETDVRELMAGLSIAADGNASLQKSPSDQRYAQPFSGAYWQISRQISRQGAVVARSRSLWDEEISLPNDELPSGEVHVHSVPGPQAQQLIVIERSISVRRSGGTFSYRLAAGLDQAESRAAINAFGNDLTLALTLLGACLLAAFAIAVSVGLRPLSNVRGALLRLRSGETTRLAGDFPREVKPLVSDLNELLEQRDRSIASARARAGDLAHGLKTPITAISVIAEELGEGGNREIADELQGYVNNMQGHVEHELVRARSAGMVSAGAVNLLSAIEPLVRSMRRLPRGCELEWAVDVAPDLSIRIDRSALSEVLGNLFDNARKWARNRIEIRSAVDQGNNLVIDVIDDGPGVPKGEHGNVMARGKRLDESVPGSGFGLAIAAGFIEQIGGRLDLLLAEGGGLRARIILPEARYQDDAD